MQNPFATGPDPSTTIDPTPALMQELAEAVQRKEPPAEIAKISQKLLQRKVSQDSIDAIKRNPSAFIMPQGGRTRRAHKGRTLKASTLRRMLKKKGKKTTGKKATLLKRLKE